MNIKRILGSIALGVAASAGGNAQAKVLAFRLAALTEAQTKDKLDGKFNASDTCLYALNTELRRAGITTQEATGGADAEMVVSLEFIEEEPWPMGDQKKILYSLTVKSVPEQHLLYADQGDVENKDPVKGCAKLAKTAIKKFLAAGGLK